MEPSPPDEIEGSRAVRAPASPRRRPDRSLGFTRLMNTIFRRTGTGAYA